MSEVQQRGFRSSVVSYRDRGPDGDRLYRGNTTGRIIEDFLYSFHPAHTLTFLDPMQGSGTSGDVARRLGIPYAGFDLRTGFDAVRDDLRSRIDEKIGSAFVHPPYSRMIPYSGSVWGTQPDDRDLSAHDDLGLFLEQLQAVLQNVYRALESGGYYGLLLGGWRRKGTYIPLAMHAYALAPGTLVAEIQKLQWNCRTPIRVPGTFIETRHETLLVFRREADGSIIGMSIAALDRLARLSDATWRNLVLGSVRAGDVVRPCQLTEQFRSHPKARNNSRLDAKMRQMLQYLERDGVFERISRGHYQRVA